MYKIRQFLLYMGEPKLVNLNIHIYLAKLCAIEVGDTNLASSGL